MKLRQLPLLFLLPSLRKNLNPRCRRKVMRRIVHRISRSTRRNRLIHTDGETTADPLLEDQQTINAADDEATAVTETDTDKIESSETEFTDESASSEMPTAEPSFTPEPTETPNPVTSPEPMEMFFHMLKWNCKSGCCDARSQQSLLFYTKIRPGHLAVNGALNTTPELSPKPWTSAAFKPYYNIG